ERAWLWCRCNPVVAGLLALVALSLVVGTLVSAWQAIRAIQAEGLAETRLEGETEARATAEVNFLEAKKQEKRAITNANDAKAQQQVAEEQERLARRRFYAAQMNLAQQAWNAGDKARVLELLESQRPRFDREDLRSFEWYSLWRLCHLQHRLTLTGRSTGWCAVFSPDGKTLATTSREGGAITLWDAATGKKRQTLQGYVTGWNRLAFSPDGKTLAHSNGPTEKETTLWDLETGTHRVLEGTGSVRWLAVSPDGKMLATGSHPHVRLWDMATRRL